MTRHRALVVAALLLAGTAHAAAPRFVDYLYIEANEGGSSGGHAALRLGDQTYHFQHEAGGVLRIRRDGSEHFRYVYGLLENRNMHLSRIPVSDATYDDLRQRFSERFLIERKVFDERDALDDDRVLLAQLLARRRGDATAAVRLRGVGFFFPADGGATSPTTLALRRRVEESYGPDFASRRIDELRVTLARLTPTSASSSTPDIPAQGYPQFEYPFSRRYRDLLTAIAALEALERGLPLRADARRTSASAAPELDATERQALAGFADRLTEQLVRLLRSERPDWGYPFLVGMARLAALRDSERTGRLVLLDAYPPGAQVISSASVRSQGDVAGELLVEAGEAFADARKRLSKGPIDEHDYAELEAAGNRLLELDAAVVGMHDLRVAGDPLLPSRDAAWADLVVPDVTDAELAGDLQQAKSTARLFTTRVERRYAYDLFSRNCVSEIFETIGAAADDLGGPLDGRGALRFIPFVSARAVDARWNVAERTTLWSYRRARLDEMYRHESPVRAWLRESNTLTSTIYRRNPDDSFFLFFTDDVVALRPLLGVLNVASAVAAGVVGAALLPFDRGRTLVSGLRGAVFSLPELALVNLRKGSFPHLPRAERPRESHTGALSQTGTLPRPAAATPHQDS